MFRIAICDDDICLCSEIEKTIQRYNNKIKIDIFYSGEKILNAIASRQFFDLIFLDIEMDILNGVEVGTKIRKEMNNNITQIVYISSKENYAMKLFKVRPFDFLVKPLHQKDIIMIIDKIVELSCKANHFFECAVDGVQNKIPLDQILYFESQVRKVKISTINGSCFIYGKLYEIKENINVSDFVIVHRSYLVNFSHVKKYSYEQLTMSNDDIISISQINRKAVRTYFLNQRSKSYD